MIILTIEQYESTVKLLNLLENFGIKSAERSHSSFVKEEGPEWVPCEYCAELQSECRCDDAPNYYAEYDDEASYE